MAQILSYSKKSEVKVTVNDGISNDIKHEWRIKTFKYFESVMTDLEKGWKHISPEYVTYLTIYTYKWTVYTKNKGHIAFRSDWSCY